MRVRLTKRARADLESIYSYVHADNPKAAADLVGRIEQLFEMLETHPALGHPTNPPGRHVVTVPRATYRVFYWIAGSEVRILRVRHTSRNPLRNAT